LGRPQEGDGQKTAHENGGVVRTRSAVLLTGPALASRSSNAWGDRTQKGDATAKSGKRREQNTLGAGAVSCHKVISAATKDHQGRGQLRGEGPASKKGKKKKFSRNCPQGKTERENEAQEEGQIFGAVGGIQFKGSRGRRDSGADPEGMNLTSLKRLFISS